VYGGPAHAGELIKASGRNGVTESMFLDSPSATPPWVVVLFAGDDGAVRVTDSGPTRMLGNFVIRTSWLRRVAVQRCEAHGDVKRVGLRCGVKFRGWW
jgi:hypothetical protein